jgi:hypothetical protein
MPVAPETAWRQLKAVFVFVYRTAQGDLSSKK